MTDMLKVIMDQDSLSDQIELIYTPDVIEKIVKDYVKSDKKIDFTEDPISLYLTHPNTPCDGLAYGVSCLDSVIKSWEEYDFFYLIQDILENKNASHELIAFFAKQTAYSDVTLDHDGIPIKVIELSEKIKNELYIDTGQKSKTTAELIVKKRDYSAFANGLFHWFDNSIWPYVRLTNKQYEYANSRSPWEKWLMEDRYLQSGQVFSTNKLLNLPTSLTVMPDWIFDQIYHRLPPSLKAYMRMSECDISSEEVISYVNHIDPIVRAKVAATRHLSKENLTRLAVDSNPIVRRGVALSPNLTIDFFKNRDPFSDSKKKSYNLRIIESLIRDTDATVRAAAAKQDISEDLLISLASDVDTRVVATVMFKDSFPKKTLRHLRRHHPSLALRSIADHALTDGQGGNVPLKVSWDVGNINGEIV